jgi:N-acetylglutamate synthase and related acetyltransferases
MGDLQVSHLAEKPEFIPLVAKWIYDEWGTLDKSDSLEKRIAQLTSQCNRGAVPLTLVAHVDGEAVGTASLIENDLDTHPDLTPWLASVYVDPTKRRMGAGKALVTRIMEECGKMRIDVFYLWTDKEERYYASLGWKLEFREEYRGMQVSVMSYMPQ